MKASFFYYLPVDHFGMPEKLFFVLEPVGDNEGVTNVAAYKPE